MLVAAAMVVVAESLVVLVGRVGRSICAYCLRVLLGVCRDCFESRRVCLVRGSRLALLVPGNHLVLLDLGSCLGCLVLLDLGSRRVLLGLDRAGCEIAGDEKV